jgi:hypothetical protein
MHTRTLIVMLASMVAIGCSKKTNADDVAGSNAEAAPKEQVPPLDPTPDRESLKKHMKGHFEAIREIQRAVVHGKLDKAKEKAKWLAEHQAHDTIADWKPHLHSLRASADELSRAENLAMAAGLTARLGDECANCHTTLTAITSFEWNELPNESGDTKIHMKRHQWAADRMWEGLVGPSDDLWSKGAEVLADAPLAAEKVTDDPKLAGAATKLAEQIHRLGKKALQTDDREERVGLFAELLGTCSTCHSITKKGKQL